MPPSKVKFVSRKISRVKWQPKSSTLFVTGSYDDEKNNVCVWKFPDVSNDSDDIDYEKNDDPQIVSCERFRGSVTDLKVTSEDLFFASSSLGFVSMFKYSNEEIQCMHTWERAHHFQNGPASATGISIKGQDLASVGEDGKLCLFNLNTNKKFTEIGSSDLCSFNCVTYLRYEEVVAGNSLGYLRLWDIRSSCEIPSSLLTLSRDQRGVSSLNVHPAQTHILATGYEDGSLCIWDMRQEKKPLSLLEGHSGAITELLFHPTNPDFLYTCSLDGSVWQWDSSNLRSSVPSSSGAHELSSAKGNNWLICDSNKHKLEATSLFCQTRTCVNSLDFSGSTLIWGTDNEELCILNDIDV